MRYWLNVYTSGFVYIDLCFYTAWAESSLSMLQCTTAQLYILVMFKGGKSLASTMFKDKADPHQSKRWRDVIRTLGIDVVQTSNLSGLKRYFERF
jgi:hypothetical protein